MGECITYFIEPTVKKNKTGIIWEHDFYLTDLADNDLVAFVLLSQFEDDAFVVKRAKEVAHYCKMRSRPMSLAERGVIVRALKQVKIKGMDGTNFVHHARHRLAEMDNARIQRLALIGRA